MAGATLALWIGRADKLELAWQIAPGDREYLTTDNTQRGIAYNPSNQHLLLVSRAGGNRIVVLNAETGEYLHDLMYDSGVIAGGTFAVNMIGVADDGAVFVGNLALPTTNPAGPPHFKLYRWANDTPDAYPELAYEGDPANGASNQRWGDSLNVRGAGLNTQVVLGTRANDRVAVFTTTDGFLFSPTMIAGAATGAGTLGIAFGEGDSLWLKLNNQPLRQVSFNLATGTATLLRSFATPAIPNGITPIGVSGKYLGGVFVDSGTSTANGPDSLSLYDISNLASSPVLVDQKEFPVNNANGNFVGSVDFANGWVFALDTNCGLVAHRIVATLEPVEILAQPANLAVLEGSHVAFNVGAKGTLPLGYQWYFEGSPLAGATQSILTLARVRADQAGRYMVRVKNQVNEVESAEASLTVLPVVQSDALTLKWKLSPGDQPWLATDDKQRGLAYNPANGHLLVLSRTPGEGIHVLDGQTGQELHQMTIDTAVITGGTYLLDMIAVADDGAVYAGNLTTAAPSSPFKLYRWENDHADTVPTLAFEGDPTGGGSAPRWGDAIDIRGAGANAQVLISSRFGKAVAVLTTADGINFVATPFTVEDAADGQLGLGLAFGEGNQFFGKQAGTSLRSVEFDLGTGAATTLRDYTLVQVPGTVFAVAYDAKTKFLAGLALETGDNVRLYDLADPANPVLIDQELFPTDNPNINGTGAADFGGDMLFALDSNNGIMAFTVKKPSSPATLATPRVHGANFEFTVQGAAGVTYDVQGSTDLKDWSVLSGVSGGGPSFVASIPMAGQAYRFFRAVAR
jgi:hypothetical protein